ncbi:structural protein [Xenorhabdus bovienii]|uniref:structural protein n=1 Tax=Xenorhabdus bovienii TaxID=40576 RepID=UPI00237D2AF1|nr:structural protein [Xenorhabdus bovienii]MDE1489100.1 structural protein [Xenorhabdus bovienii]MDE9479894.1 structural protein [Xenorhabdus bovienii]MDE9532826.1 structural protein [Xenorhabdus bovienii]
MSRGIRNNNPGNIDHNSANKWQGQLPHDPSIEKRFCRFESPEYGIRALMKLLCNYHKKGYQTVAKMIDRWAPNVENNTSAYINGVAKALGVDPHQVIAVDKVTLIALAKSIIRHENGKQPYSDPVFEKAWSLL